MIRRKALLASGLAAALLAASAVPLAAHGQQSKGYGMGQGGAGDCPHRGIMGQGQGMGPGMMDQGMGMGPGMMGQGMGPGMMGQGQGMSPGMMGQGQGMSPGMMGPGMMGPGMMGQGMGPGMMGQGYAAPPADLELTVEDVTKMLEHRLAWQRNPNIKLGAVEATDEDTIVAEIVTQDGSLVQRLAVDRQRGWMRPAN